ncbi:hypothetical protein P43SY_010404 [Pythium insidiosum]|uniref:Uncharacterized protein n=1 Tax=Pythium insidiosum TaxID=114742 RepID=A0AAD5LR25_PYTIN|nr:hypothetical protein P43SY_010404 [Pythium insidiosum]KAJ0410824.1 hypothetical protein ATCC90586_010147 [Pythium insidiosum]
MDVDCGQAFTAPVWTLPSRRDVLNQETALLSPHIRQCIAFLKRVNQLRVRPGDSSKTFCIEVSLDATSDNTSASFSVDRTLDELKELRFVLVHWTSKHEQLHARYGVGPCTFCTEFTSSEAQAKWPKTGLGSLLSSTSKRAEALESCLMQYIDVARGPSLLVRRGAVRCEGVEHVPSILCRFLLKDVDHSTI